MPPVKRVVADDITRSDLSGVGLTKSGRCDGYRFDVGVSSSCNNVAFDGSSRDAGRERQLQEAGDDGGEGEVAGNVEHNGQRDEERRSTVR